MKKLIASLLFAWIFLASQNLHAAGNDNATLSFWDKLRAKIEQIVPQKKVTATTAVGGVRGAKMATDDVYWKGEKVDQAVDAEELGKFKSAMALASNGELPKAQAAFTEFITENPDSPLRKDAEQALAQLKSAN